MSISRESDEGFPLARCDCVAAVLVEPEVSQHVVVQGGISSSGSVVPANKVGYSPKLAKQNTDNLKLS